MGREGITNGDSYCGRYDSRESRDRGGRDSRERESRDRGGRDRERERDRGGRDHDRRDHWERG